MKVSFGILLVTLPYSYPRGKVIYYQRPVPTDLRHRYTSKVIKVKLTTSNIRAAARQIEILNRGVEAEWKAMRASPELLPRTIKQQAEDLLRDWDLAPVALAAGDDAAFLFHSHLDQKREAFARGDEDVYREADPSDYLKPHEIEAAKLIAGSSRPRLTDALDLYLSRHPKRNNEKFTKYAKQSFGRMVAAIGDKVLEDVSRDDGHEFVTLMLKEGLASASVRRLLNTARTVMATYIKERKVYRTNPFDSIPIPDEGEDVENAVPYTSKELSELVAACKVADDEPRWLLSLIADTGCRLAEAAGLSLDDIRLDDPVPHIVIKVHPWRSLKNKSSARDVPLLGASLWAAKRVKANMVNGETFAFPRYNKSEKTNSNSASAALNKWIKSTLEQEHIVHELRHTLADRLRDVQCPSDVRLAIGGWTVRGVGEDYGKGYTLRVRSEWLAKVIP